MATELIALGRHRYGLFFVHLAIEKLLKAHFCLHTGELAPRTYNLVYLAERAGLNVDTMQSDVLADLNPFNIEGRYPSPQLPGPTADEAKTQFQRAEEIYEWLTRLF